MALRRGEMETANEGVSVLVDAIPLAALLVSSASSPALRTVGMPMLVWSRSAILAGEHSPPNLRDQDPRRLVYLSEPISTLVPFSSPNFRAKSHSSSNLHPSRGLVRENTSYCCHGMAGATDCVGCKRMNTRPGKETNLDSSDARFEVADLN